MVFIAESTPQPDSSELLPSLKFSKAAPVWYDTHAQHVSAGTRRHYTNCLNRLMKSFGDLRLEEIRIGHLEQYQKLRSAGEGGMRRAGPSLVNHELNTLSQILSYAGLWAPIERRYRPMKLPRPRVGCALSPEEEQRLFQVASRNPRWKVVYCCSVISANTTLGPNEIRHLRRRDVNMSASPQPVIRLVEGLKNEYRERDLPLNEFAAPAMAELLARAQEIGAIEPDHYLLPHRAQNGAKGFDPTRPISSWRGAWGKLTKAAGLPHLRIYDLRHHAITKLLENPNTSERTVIEIAGHVSRQMLQRYSHIRMKSKVDAVNGLVSRSSKAATQPFLSVSGTVAFMMPFATAATLAASSPAVPKKPAAAAAKLDSPDSHLHPAERFDRRSD
jgi:integrase